MLQLQRASAGSGKTYALARKYIWFLLATRRGAGWRLRKDREIADSLQRILAITFTNKATEEMKQRIVERLRDLSGVESLPSMTPDEVKAVPYLADYMQALQTADHRAIGRAARQGLGWLLNDYTNFKVSTIDAFFQTILRTFAYESNLAESFQIEIDSEFLSNYGVDATLEGINTSRGSEPASFWMKVLMARKADTGGGNWNVFQKSMSQQALLPSIVKAIKQFDKEDFRAARTVLDAYFGKGESPDPLVGAYSRLETEWNETMLRATAAAREAANRLISTFAEEGLDPKQHGVRYMDTHIAKIAAVTPDTFEQLNKFKPLRIEGTALKKGVSTPAAAALRDRAAEMYARWEEAVALWNHPKWRHWRVYRQLMPLLGLIGEARKEINRYLDGVNSIHLSETSSILRRIIGDDDTPFVYERIGSVLNHYLIDEFQDTSRLQWEVLRPLVGESLGRGEDNLIIGDAKQSIYRFRSADPSLITTAVPADFPDFEAGGYSRADNSNHRSDRTVIEFNNMFFRGVAAELAAESQGVVDFADLYRNVVQYAAHRERRGYVEIDFIERPGKSGKNKKREDDDEGFRSQVLQRVGPLVESILERGYRQKDIAFLVRGKDDGKAVIGALRAHNALKAPGETPIEFISEESLLISGSEAVAIIITVLEKMGAGVFRTATEEPGAGNEKARWFDWNEIKCNFNFYALRHPGDTLGQVEGFLQGGEKGDPVGEMLSAMQATALPALVEAITESFVPADLRRDQAVFISAFQDVVLKYCSAKAADVASFLEWWKEKGVNESIQMPDGVDAVQVMTIHKSKGLEFACVVVPFCDDAIVPGPRAGGEWRWVALSSSLKGCGLPEVVPVLAQSALLETDHAGEYRHYRDMATMDNLNLMYVAFTRAVNELYVFTQEPSPKSTGSISSFLQRLCVPGEGTLEGLGETEDCLCRSDGRLSADGRSLAFGEQTSAPPRKGEATGKEERVIGQYGVNSNSGHLQYSEGDDEGGSGVRPDAADTDPRSEGNLIHALMAGVRTRGDIGRNALALAVKGRISRRQAREWTTWLTELTQGDIVREWFAGGWEVLNERSLLMGRTSLIPDRVLLDRKGKRMAVIDYKTGEAARDGSHRRQVKSYMEALREATGISDIRGYLWYLRSGKVEEVR